MWRCKKQGALVIPESRYPNVAEIILRLKSNDAFYGFLANRCDRRFLEYFMNDHFVLEDRGLEFGSFMTLMPEVDFVIKLSKLSLLPYEIRVAFIENIKELAVETPDADFLSSSRIRDVLTEKELNEIMVHVDQNLIPKLHGVIIDWRDNCGSKDEPIQYFYPLLEALKTFKEHIENKESILEIEDSIHEIEEMVSELQQNWDVYQDELYQEYRDDQLFFEEPLTGSIFDDVDE